MSFQDVDESSSAAPSASHLSMAKYKRRKKLIDPSLQLKLTVVFVGLTAMGLLLQFGLFARNISHVALRLPNDGLLLVNEMSSLVTSTLVWSFLVFLPITFVVGILTTFRIAGPLYRFRVFMTDILRGDKPADCRIRKGDQLQDFCDLLNRVTAPLREQSTENSESEGTDLEQVASLSDKEPAEALEQHDATSTPS